MIQGFAARSDAVAVFVDGDNLGHQHADAILDAASARGHVVLCRVYGDVTRLPGWSADPRFAAQHAPSARGKNNADIRLVIDAVDYAQAGRARVFVIASNDSDFGPLAVRLREAGHVVVGIGGAGAAHGLKAACSEFLELPPVASAAPKPPNPKLDTLDRKVCKLIDQHGADGKISLAVLGSWLGKQGPARAHGQPTWRAVLAQRADRFVLEGTKAATVVSCHPERPELR